jgi:hypothetical protein
MAEEHYLSKSSGKVECDYLDIKNSNAVGARWYAGNHSVDSGNNTGWRFRDYVAPSTEKVGEPTETGVYTLGRYSPEYPMVLDFTYPISERNNDGTFVLDEVQIGSILVDGSDIFVAWTRFSDTGDSFGIDKVDPDNKLNGAYLETRVMTGNREVYGNFAEFIIPYSEIPTGTNIAIKYSKDFGSNWVTCTTVKDTDRKILYSEDEVEATTLQLRIVTTASGNNAPAIERGDIVLR